MKRHLLSSSNFRGKCFSCVGLGHTKRVCWPEKVHKRENKNWQCTTGSSFWKKRGRFSEIRMPHGIHNLPLTQKLFPQTQWHKLYCCLPQPMHAKIDVYQRQTNFQGHKLGISGN